jgi:hypothetical protein
MSAWTTNVGLVIQGADVYAGAFAARAQSSTGTAAYASKTLSCTQASLYYRVRFKLVSKSATTPLYLFKFRTSANASIGGIFLTEGAKLAYRNDTAGSAVTVASTRVVTSGVWHEVQASFTVNGSAGQVAVWLDGEPMTQLNRTDNLGTTPIGRVQLGENATGRNFDLILDDVCIDVVACPMITPGSLTPTPTLTTAPTNIPNATESPSSTPTGTSTPSPTPTQTASPTSTQSPTQTATATVGAPTPTQTAVGPTATATAVSPTPTPTCWAPFADGFESDSMNQWTSTNGLVVQQLDVDSGAWASSGSSTAGTMAFARRLLSCDQTSLYFRLRFKIVSKDATSLYLIKFRTNTADASIGGLYVGGKGELAYRSDAGGFNVVSTTARVTTGSWHTVQLHFDVTNQKVEVWYDGAVVADLTRTAQNLGTVAIGRAQLGENSTGHTFDVRFDNVCVDTGYCSDGPSPTPTPSPSPSPTQSPTATPTTTSSDAVVMAAGDIACGAKSAGGKCVQSATYDLIAAQQPDAVLLLGDDQYECGQINDFTTYFAPTWGRSGAAIKPSIGNHEYTTSTDPANPCYAAPAGAPGYWAYFGAASHPLDPNCSERCSGYYSFDVGAWHVVVINSVCSQVSGGCGAGSPQERWLRADLAAHPNACTLAYWHHPLYSSGQWGNNTSLQAIWQALYDYGADVVLAGHDHNYERFAPQDAAGNLDVPRGITEFVVGTGGRNLGPAGTTRANSAVFNRTTFGVLKLTLHANGYDWQFLPIAGSTSGFTDSGSASCHGVSANLTDPHVLASADSGSSGPGQFGQLVASSEAWWSAAIFAVGSLVLARRRVRTNHVRSRDRQDPVPSTPGPLGLG